MDWETLQQAKAVASSYRLLVRLAGETQGWHGATWTRALETLDQVDIFLAEEEEENHERE